MQPNRRSVMQPNGPVAIKFTSGCYINEKSVRQPGFTPLSLLLSPFIEDHLPQFELRIEHNSPFQQVSYLHLRKSPQ